MSRAVALYARVSSDKQAKEGGADSQVSAIKEYAVKKGVTIEADLVFVDNGISGSHLERPALDALRDKAAQGQIERVIIHNPDRLARKHVHQLLLVEEFQKLGVAVEFVNHAISATPEDQLLLQIQGVIAEYEREKIIERNRRGKLHRARQGRVSTLVNAPYGYVYIPKAQSTDARYEIHPEEAAVVKSVFEMFCHQRLAVRAIADCLTERRIPTRFGARRWGSSVVWAMLRNPAYCGHAAFRKTIGAPRQRATKHARDRGGYPKRGSRRARPQSEWISIPVPAIVDESTFTLAGELLAENKRLATRNNHKHHYLLSGLAHCKVCGYSLYGFTPTARPYLSYYRCAGLDGRRFADRKPVCSGHDVRVEVLDELVWQSTQRLLEQPKVVFDEYVRRANQEQTTADAVDGWLARRQQEINHLNHEKERLLDLYQTGSIELVEVETRLAKIRRRIKDAEAEQNLLRQRQVDARTQLRLIEKFEVFRDKVIGRLDSLSFDEKKALVRLVVTEVIVNTEANTLTIKHIFPEEPEYKLCSGSLQRQVLESLQGKGLKKAAPIY